MSLKKSLLKKESLKNLQKQLQKDKRLYKTYGITLEDFNTILNDQKGGCAVCGRSEGRLCVDHIHILGFKKLQPEDKRKFIRGVVCFYCNTSFKGFERTRDGIRNRQQLEGTFKYFQKYRLKGE